MDTLVAEQNVRQIKRKRTENEGLQFEEKWQHSISIDEFLKKTHEHLKNLYAARDKKQNGSAVFAYISIQ